VTGATPTYLLAGYGYVARRLATRLLANHPGATLCAHNASGEPGDGPGLRPEVIDLDATPVRPLESAGSRICYSIPPPRQGTTDERLARWLAALAGTPDCLVYISTTGVYGDQGGRLVDESTPPQPKTDRARRRVDAERRVLEWCAERGVRAAVIRAPGIYGPGRLPLARLERGDPVLDPALCGPGQHIHVDDLVTVLARVLDDEHAEGIYNVGDDAGWSLSRYLLAVADHAGLPRPPIVDREQAARRLSPAMLEFFSESRRLDVARMREELGIEPRYPSPETGIPASLGATRDEAEGSG
jgi:dTDP-4-dehydrorhamnose reductase